MGNNFQDNVAYGQSTLAVSGDAIIVGSTDNGAKSVIFNNSGSQGHLAWQPTGNETIYLPNSGGTVQLTGQVPGAVYDGANSITSGTIVFTNANGVSFSINGQTLSASVAAVSSLSATGIVSISSNGNTISIGAPVQSINFSAGTTSNNLTNVVLSNSNGVSFGLNGSTITGSVAAQSAQTQNVVVPSAGTQTATSGTVIFSNSNGFSFGMSNSSVITASYTVPTQTVQTIGLYALGNTTQNSSTTLDARSISFQGAGIASVGYSNGSVVISVPSGGGAGDGVNILAAGTQTANTTGSVLFSNSNGISFGMSNSSVITASFNGTLNSVVFSNANNITFGSAGNTTITASYSQSNQNISLFALGNTTQNSSTVLGANVVSFNGLGIITAGYSNGSIQISAIQSNQTQSNIQAVYDGANSISTGTIRFTNANGVSFSVNGQTISGSVAAQTVQTIGLYALGNTTQNSSTTLDARTLSFNAIGNITVGFSNGSIQLSYPIINTLNDYEREPLIATTGVNMSIGSWYFEPFIIPAYISGGRINRIIGFGAATNNMLMATSSASFSSATVGTRSINVSYMNSLALYQLGTGTNSTRLESLWSNTFSFGLAQSVSVSTDGGSSVHVTNAATLSYIASINSAGSYTTTTLAASTNTSSASAAMACSAVTGGVSSIINMLSNIVIIPVGFNTTISAGNYWLAQAWTGGTTTAGTVGTAFTYSQNINLSAAAQGFKLWGQTTNVQLMPGAGNFTTTSASPMATVPFASIVTCATVMRNYWNYVNSTI
jgi:hypothetical protein